MNDKQKATLTLQNLNCLKPDLTIKYYFFHYKCIVGILYTNKRNFKKVR